MIPTVNLDDRTFDDIRDEAIRLIPRYCPEWTNHNASDPGITLIELFSWMTEMTLYRLNKVPSKTYLSMLELMGLTLNSPQSSRSIIKFYSVENCNKAILVKAGTKIASVESDSEPIVFETDSNLTVRDTSLASCINRVGEKWDENCAGRDKVKNFLLFETNNSIEHCLYVSSPIFKYLCEGHGIQIAFEPASEIISVSDEIVNHIFWEYWDGKKWVELDSFGSLKGIKKADDVVYVKGPADIQPCVINGVEGLFLRGVLSDVPEKENTLNIKSIRLKSIFEGDGFIPDICLMNSNGAYAAVDMNNTFPMFSEQPTFNEVFYIAADEIFRNRKSLVKITFSFSEVYVSDSDNENALFSYEYWNGKDWIKLDSEKNGFVDGTFNFKQSGTVSFKIPKDISETDVNNESHLWIRIRLVTKDFSIGGNYVQDEKGSWKWDFSSKVQSPLMSKIRITYNAPVQYPESVSVSSDFKWKNLDGLTRENKDGNEYSIFDVRKNEMPSLLLGFSKKIKEGNFPVYFLLDENCNRNTGYGKDLSFMNLEGESGNQKRGVSLEWQFWNGNEWRKLEANDYTDSFHESGFIDFIIPPGLQNSRLYDRDLYWIRCVKLNGSFERVPFIKDIVINAVYASNQDTYRNEVIGSGNGAPGQVFNVAHSNLLPGMKLFVNECSVPSNNEIDLMKKDGIDVPYEETDKAVWVSYKEVPNFYNSNAFSRHYVVDYSTGKIMFGDGVHGINPPKGKFNIRIAEYKVGGGEAGNVAAHKLQFLTQSIPYIAGCDNPFASEGGCDMESIDSLKSRAAGVFKSLNRGVTREDFEWLCREASSSVGRSYCLREKTTKGEIKNIVIPKLVAGNSCELKLVPSRELLRRVRKHLDETKLVGTKVVVEGPVYRDFEITLSVEFKSSVFDFDNEKQKIKDLLLTYFHSLFGGAKGNGWEFGKPVTVGIILKQLEKIGSLLSINETKIFDVDANVMVESFSLKEDELPFLRNVIIVGK